MIKNRYFYYNNLNVQKIGDQAKKFFLNVKQKASDICEISVKRYLELPKYIRRSLKGYYASVEFPEQKLKIHPYMIGLLLGNKSNHKILYALFDKCGIKKEVHIPYIYRCNSRENRLMLLAGLLNSQGSKKQYSFKFLQKDKFELQKDKFELQMSLDNKQMIDDILYLCRSLGLLCSKKEISGDVKIYKGVRVERKICKITISGPHIILQNLKLNNIMTKDRIRNINRTKDQIKNNLVSSIYVKQLEEDDYYGFMIDKNERFLLGNFTVTHNTKIIRSLADALDLPFYQINFGGLNDSSVLTGHSETYVGSKPGKIVEILTNSKWSNPIIYLDEIDKISESKAVEIFGILTHLLDEEQNGSFQDNYLSHIHLDLSKVFFVLAFNDITKVDEIVSDRLKIIYIDPPNLHDKIIICQTKMIPEILSSININKDYNIIIDEEIIAYIISMKTPQENGVRQLRKNIEKIFNRLNYDILIGEFDELRLEGPSKNIIVTKSYVDNILKLKSDDNYLTMYN